LRAATDNQSTKHEQAPGHEDSQFIEVAESAPPGLPSHPPSRPHLRDQQDEPPLQGAPGLISLPLALSRGHHDIFQALPERSGVETKVSFGSRRLR